MMYSIVCEVGPNRGQNAGSGAVVKVVLLAMIPSHIMERRVWLSLVSRSIIHLM
jgi:hypothetical protein